MPLRVLLATLLFTPALPALATVIDLAGNADAVLRIHGSLGDGRVGTPVSGGQDVSADGQPDYLLSSLLADPQGRDAAGVLFLVLGQGQTQGQIDTAVRNSRLLEIQGASEQELAGVVHLMADVTADGVADVVIGRPNFLAPDGRIGVGAVTILPGGEALAGVAAGPATLDLADPPAELTVLTLHGAAATDRFGMWLRSGDVDGDGVADLIIGADQVDQGDQRNAGEVTVLRGGVHLRQSGLIDMAEFGSTPLAGEMLQVRPPPGSANFHFGATADIRDLDGNGRGELLIAATLARANGNIAAAGADPADAVANGGAPNGRLYIVWDQRYPRPWIEGLQLSLDEGQAGLTRISGGARNLSFGEEILSGDYDGDGVADLFVGDLRGDARGAFDRDNSGTGHVLFNAPGLLERSFDLDNPPAGQPLSLIVGTGRGAISADTAAGGDFDGDGRDDIGLASPHGSPQGRIDAGSFHLLFGQQGAWPARIELDDSAPADTSLRNLVILGARGTAGGDTGDVLAYSAISADVDGDGVTDLLLNEMLGNGTSAEDVGNLVVLTGAQVQAALAAPTPSPSPTPRPSAGGGGGGGIGLVWLWLSLAGLLRRRAQTGSA